MDTLKRRTALVTGPGRGSEARHRGLPNVAVYRASNSQVGMATALDHELRE